MTHTLYAVTLLLFGASNHTNASQKPQEKYSDAQKAKWEADAQQFARLTAAMGGKMLHTDKEITPEQKNKPKIIDITTTAPQVRARL